jgi:hypothetical protein
MNFSFFFILLAVLVPILCIDHAFVFKVNENGSQTIKVNGTKVKIQIKKVNVDLIIDGLVYRRKQAHGKREDKFFHYSYQCKPCEDLGKYTSCRVLCEVRDIEDPECDVYTLIEASIRQGHVCLVSGKIYILYVIYLLCCIVCLKFKYGQLCKIYILYNIYPLYKYIYCILIHFF